MEKIKADKILLSGGTILHVSTGQKEKTDIVIINGKIDKIGIIDKSSFSGKIYDITQNLVVPGLMDMHVHFREPGREDEETITTGCAAAMAGGFTAVCTMPNTTPACDNQEVIKYIKKRAEDELVNVYPIAAITKKRKGQEITEMAELVRAGAVAFSDDGSPLVNSMVMRNALTYASMYETPIIDHCEDPFLFQGGHMNESIMSTKLGIPGIPNAAESIMIARNIELAKLTGGRIHIAHMSVKEGVDLVRRAKEDGVSITCEVTPHHLYFTDQDLTLYNSDLKMNPPLRTHKDIEILLKGIKDGTIDTFASDHAPHSIEEKDVEFNAAPFGIVGLETMLGALLQKIVQENILSIEAMLEKLTITPRKILNIPVPQIKEGAIADLTIFNPTQIVTVHKEHLKSKSKNTPFDGCELPGKIFAVLNKKMIWVNSDS